MNITQYRKQIKSLELASSVDNNTTEQLHHPIDNYSINDNNILEENISYINIGTHNVRGFHNRGKQRVFMDAYNEYKLDIVGVTETKLPSKQSNNILIDNKYYKSWWTGLPDNNYTGGVGIAIKKGLHQYVHKVEYKLGRKINLKIINIYVNSNDTEKIEKDNLLKELNKLITEANVSKSHLIIMGDFNADAEKYDALNKTVTKGKYKIIQLLRDQGLYDTQKLTNINLQYTWKKNNETKRRIDYIWINDYMIEDLLITKVILCDELNTDHNILAMTINSSNIFGRRTISTEKKKKIKRDIYTIDKMTDELWAKFRTRLDELSDKYGGFNNIFMVPNKHQNWVNNTWDKLENILKTTMDEIIPIKSIVKSDQPRRPKLKYETFKTYKWCLHIIRSIKRDELKNITIGKKHKFIDNLQYIIQKYK